MLVKSVDIHLGNSITIHGTLDSIKQDQISINEAMIFLHYALILLSKSKLQKSTLTESSSAKTCRLLVLFFRLCERAVIEAKLFAVFYVFLCKHPNTVHLV